MSTGNGTDKNGKFNPIAELMQLYSATSTDNRHHLKVEYRFTKVSFKMLSYLVFISLN